MFQSIANIFNSSSNLWNIEHLQKVLKIPQDQLEELENIPGWTSGKKETAKDKTDIPLLKKTKESTTKSIPGKVKSKKVNSSINLKTPRILLHDNITLDTDKTFTFSNNKKQSSLVRSISLSSLNKLTRCYSNRVLKRSSSTPSVNIDSLLNFNSDNSVKMSNIVHAILKEPFSKMLPLSSRKSFDIAATAKEDAYVEKSQFINSAVQCQMSQSEFENNDKVVIASQTVDIQIENSVPVTHVIPSNDSNSALENKFETEVCFPRPILDDQKEIHVGNENRLSPKIIETNKSNEDAPKFHVPDVEESFISLPIPCAQPLLTHTTSNIAVCAAQKATGSFETDAIPNKSGKISEDIPEKKNNFAIKRKRKNKQEKLPKKFRTMRADEIEIVYSIDEITNMMETIRSFFYV